MAGDYLLNRMYNPTPTHTEDSGLGELNTYKSVDEARAAATGLQKTGGYVIAPYQHRLRYLNSDQRASRTVPEFETRYALAPAPPTPDSRWDSEAQTWRGPRHYGWSDKVGDVMQVVIPAMVGAGVGGMAAGAAGGGTTGGIAGGAASGATQSVVTGGDNLAEATIGGAITGGVGASSGGDPYGYGTSVGGQAGTTATTTGLVSAARGDTLEQQVRNSTISGASSYAGGYTNRTMAQDLGPIDYDNPGTWSYSGNAGRAAGTATNLGLRELWRDPEATDMGDYYQGLVDQFTRYQNQIGNYDEPMISMEELQNTPEGSQLLAMFKQQEEASPNKRSTAGGAGQYSSGMDQLEQEDTSGYVV